MHDAIALFVVGCLLLAAGGVHALAGESVSLTVDADRVTGRIDEKVYGHFLEHIYHSCNGGLWGETVWNRSFEEGPKWLVEGGSVVQHGLGSNERLTFGDASWSDYEFTLEARKTGGAEGFLVLFRVRSAKEFYWLNFGGWGNERHAIERGLDDGKRWRVVSPPVPGGIETGRWYRVRVRCEGPRFRAWLDDAEVIDFTDDEHAHLSGAVGVGTWVTTAEYRNIEVSSLDGGTLFEGLPETPALREPATFWRAYGSGKVAPERERPLNSDCCMRITGAEGETGLEQAPFRVRAGETCRGSVWARGHAPGGISVRLVARGRTRAEATFPSPGDEWEELAFELEPSASADDATLRIGVEGEAEVFVDQVSLVPDSSAAGGGFRPDLLEAVADLRPPVIRWPGGCFASLYRWKDAVGPQHRRRVYPRSMWGDRDVNSLGTDEFVDLCRRVGAEPLIVVNVGMHEPREERDDYRREARDWVEYCNGPVTSPWGRTRAENGHPEPYNVKYWEIDNEVWKLDPGDYAAAVREFAAAMKEVDPSIVIIACGSGQLGGNWGEGDRVVIERCADVIDYLSVHHYESPDAFATGPARAAEFFRGLGDLVARSKNPALRLYVSEWNAQSTDWRTGLYAGGLLNVFERSGGLIGMAGPALFLRHVSATSWDNAFINFDHRDWFPAPNYVVMKLWREHFAPELVPIEGDASGLDATCARSADGRVLFFKAVNPSDAAVEVELAVKGARLRGAEMLVVAPGDLRARNTLEEPRRVRPQPHPVAVDGGTVRFTMPALSAGVATLSTGD